MGGPAGSTPVHRQYGGVSFWVCAVLAVTVAQTLLRIELLNACAGHYLPRRDLPPPGGDNPKWRHDITWRSAYRMLVERDFRAKNSLIYGQALTPDQEAEIERLVDEAMSRDAEKIARGETRNRLLDVVGSWGLLQYAIAPLCLIWSLRLSLSKRRKGFRIAAAAFGVLSLTAICLMVYRGYFTSLGW